jgi:hypothetical protein
MGTVLVAYKGVGTGVLICMFGRVYIVTIKDYFIAQTQASMEVWSECT